MEEESKRGRKSGEKEIIEEEDQISNLPDGALSHILSCLPTKTAVSTGRLSSRWRHLWKHLSVLDFSDDSDEYNDLHSEERFRSFALLVNGVLATFLQNPRPIRKFHLDCAHSLLDDMFRAKSVDTWVCAAIGIHLEDLDLNLFSYDNNLKYKLPLSTFTSTNLVSLSLRSTILVHLESSTPVTLPSLKMLLIDINHMEVPSVNILLCGCPNIQTLKLRFATQSLDKVCVPPSLKKLKFTIDNEVGAYLEMNAPDLEYLYINRVTSGEVFSMYNLHNVVEAHLDVFPQSYSPVLPLSNLLGNLSGTKHLVLGRSTTKWLFGEPHDLNFKELHYLLRLELAGWFNSNSLLNLLNKCPMLQVLIIQKEKSSLLAWAPTPCVPNCIISHLTSIQFKGFRGLPDEVSFVEYVLQNGLVLKTMIISGIYLDLNKKYDILKTLSDLPRASGMCRLKFD